MLLQVAARLRLVEQHVGYPEVVVVGGGYAGVELAAVVAERLQGRGRIKLVTSAADILEASPQVGGCAGGWVAGALVAPAMRVCHASLRPPPTDAPCSAPPGAVAVAALAAGPAGGGEAGAG